MNLGSSEGQPQPGKGGSAKAVLRARLAGARAERPNDPVATAARAARAHGLCRSARVVAAYASRPDEPGTAELLEALRTAGVRVLLPVLTRDPDWAWYAGPSELAPGPFGIPQPTSPALGAGALTEAEWIWLPGLAGTPDGRRLGTGGGWYDRALLHAAKGAQRGLLLYDDEILPEVPTDPWDQPVHHLVTEQRHLRCRTE